MEEGVFRGLFIQTLSAAKPFMAANFIAAFLFGVWHIVSSTGADELQIVRITGASHSGKTVLAQKLLENMR